MSIIKSLQQSLENRAIRKFLRNLVPVLRRRYGGSGPYTIAQVRAAMDAEKLSAKYQDYAYFVFCIPEEYQEYGGRISQIDRWRAYRSSPDRGSGVCGAEGGCGSD